RAAGEDEHSAGVEAIDLVRQRLAKGLAEDDALHRREPIDSVQHRFLLCGFGNAVCYHSSGASRRQRMSVTKTAVYLLLLVLVRVLLPGQVWEQSDTPGTKLQCTA